jgi:hypothetical protein
VLAFELVVRQAGYVGNDAAFLGPVLGNHPKYVELVAQLVDLPNHRGVHQSLPLRPAKETYRATFLEGVLKMTGG